MTHSPYKKKRGTLHIISALLLCSAIIRFAVNGTPLVAETALDHAAKVTAPQQHTALSQELLSDLQERETALLEQEGRLADKEQALEIAEDEINEKLEELIAAEQALRDTLALADSAAEKDLKKLALVYENMKPKDSAALFTHMEPKFAAGFLGLMNPEAAAAIMTQLDAPVAYAISVMLASRNARVPTQ